MVAAFVQSCQLSTSLRLHFTNHGSTVAFEIGREGNGSHEELCTSTIFKRKKTTNKNDYESVFDLFQLRNKIKKGPHFFKKSVLFHPSDAQFKKL